MAHSSREYQREYMRKRRAEKKRENILDEKVRSDPLYKLLSPGKQKEVDDGFLKDLEAMDQAFEEKLAEAEQYAKTRFDQWDEQMLTTIKKLVELSRSQKQIETQNIKEK